MKKQNKIYWIVGGVVVVLIVLVLASLGKNKEDNVIKIGYISSLSGNAGVWGQPLREGFDYGLNKYKSDPDSKYKIEVVYEDDACDAKTGLDAFNKVVNFEKIKYTTGTVCSSVAMSVVDIVNENNVLYLASGATTPELTKQGDKIFRLWPDDSYNVREIVKYAAKDLGVNDFSFSSINDNPTGLAMKDVFGKTVKLYNKNIISSESFSSDESDFSTVATKLIQGNPEAIYVGGTLPEQMPLLVNKLKTLGYDGYILLYSVSATTPGVLDKILDHNNLYYANLEEIKETSFWNDYRVDTGKDADMLTALGYDSFNLIKDSIEKCGENTDCARDYILSLKSYQTSRGVMGFDENGELTEVPYEVIKVK